METDGNPEKFNSNQKGANLMASALCRKKSEVLDLHIGFDLFHLREKSPHRFVCAYIGTYLFAACLPATAAAAAIPPIAPAMAADLGPEAAL
ncbi:hypothetical protein SDJN02_17566, partial [Cucurbita argyrosperma subsp. argyrosperma]